MSAYIASRRDFLRLGLATATLPFLPGLAFPEALEDQRTAWYRTAKFGMFMHWGPYSLASVEASWPIMRPKPGGITEAEYRALPKRFNPVNYNPDHFIDLARAAGQEYMVFTTKHHDGFCMFDSAYTDYKITNTPYGKDIVKQLADACARRSMPLGFYYSSPDMNNPNYRDTSRPASENYKGQPERPEWPAYLDYMQLQLTELLTGYGEVRILWFDRASRDERMYDGRRFLDLVHKLQPATLVNDRLGVPGDFVTPEQFIPNVIPTKNVAIQRGDTGAQQKLPSAADFQLWETCMTINHTWAYNANDHNYKSAQQLIRTLVEVASRGGNFLLNVGPQPDGNIQPEFQERLRAIGDWMTINGEAIYGTTFGPIQGAPGYRTTARENNIFIHIFDWPSAPLAITGVKSKVLSARMLANNQSVPFQQTEGGLQLTLPLQATDKDVSVVALRTL